MARIAEQSLARARETVASGVDLARAAGLRAEPAERAAFNTWTSASLANDIDADVLVCGTRGEGPLERAVLGSTASSLVHHADRPLLVVPPGDGTLDGPVLAGYDESKARAALRFAAAHLRERPLVVAHAWRSPIRHTLRGHALLGSGIDVFAEYATEVDAIWEEIATTAADAGAEYARGLGLSTVAAAPESGRGDWRTLLGHARRAGASAVLVGSRGRGAVAATVLGSVASGWCMPPSSPCSSCPARERFTRPAMADHMALVHPARAAGRARARSARDAGTLTVT